MPRGVGVGCALPFPVSSGIFCEEGCALCCQGVVLFGVELGDDYAAYAFGSSTGAWSAVESSSGVRDTSKTYTMCTCPSSSYSHW